MEFVGHDFEERSKAPGRMLAEVNALLPPAADGDHGFEEIRTHAPHAAKRVPQPDELEQPGDGDDPERIGDQNRAAKTEEPREVPPKIGFARIVQPAWPD